MWPFQKTFTKKLSIGNCPVCGHNHRIFVEYVGQKGKKEKAQVVILTCPDRNTDFEWTIHSENRIQRILNTNTEGHGGTSSGSRGGGGVGIP